MKPAVIKTQGRVVRKFFGDGDSRISDIPYMTLRITVNAKTVDVDKSIDREFFFACEEGDLIDLFVTDEDEMKVYPLAEIIDKENISGEEASTETQKACSA